MAPKVMNFHYSDFAMLVHIEVTEQRSCETTAPESDIKNRLRWC